MSFAELASQLYETIAPSIYLLTSLTVLTFGGLWLVRHPRRIHHYTTRRVQRILLASIVLYVMSAVLMLTGLALHGSDGAEFVRALMITGAVSGCVGAVILPFAVKSGAGQDVPAAERFTAIPILAFAGIVWSVGSISLITHFVDMEILNEGFVAQVTGMPLLIYAGFCFFAMLAAVMEEVVFRGGLQSMLERTPLGPWGAIPVTSFLFAMGHVGYITPHGIKELQIFGLSLLLGFAKVRYGLGAAIAIHVANNLFAVITELLVVR